MEGFKIRVLCYLPLALGFVYYLPLTRGFVKVYRGFSGITFERGLCENVQVIRLVLKKDFVWKRTGSSGITFEKGFFGESVQALPAKLSNGWGSVRGVSRQDFRIE